MSIIVALQAFILAAHGSKGEGSLFLVIFVLCAILLASLYRWSSVLCHRILTSYNQLVIAASRESEPLLPNIQEQPYVAVVDAYAKDILHKYGFNEHDIQLVHHYMYMLRQNGIRQVAPRTPITRHDGVSQNDLKHLAWNIGEIYGVSGYDRAYFAQTAFSSWFNGTTVETIMRTLRDNRSGKRIPLFSEDEIIAIRSK